MEPSFIQNHINTLKELKNPVKDFSALFLCFYYAFIRQMKAFSSLLAHNQIIDCYSYTDDII